MRTKKNCGCTFLLLFAMVLSASSQGTTNDSDWLIEVLQLDEGSVVAEIGAGSLTLAVARHVGSKGKVFSTELGADSVDYLKNAVDEAPDSNIVVLAGHLKQTNLPNQCCDALFLRNVYHHFKDPALMNKSMWQALRIGGRVAVIDFEPRGTTSVGPQKRDSPQHHGVMVETVVAELRNAGFTLVSKDRRSGRDIYVVMQKAEK